MTMSNYYKVVIIDDENASAKALVKELSRYPRFHVDGVAHDAESGKDMIMRIMPDLLFLDVELPEMYGMELLAEIKDSVNWSMRVVFYTAHDKYLINALRNSAFDFLLKPIDKKEFEVVISRFLLDYESKTSLFDKHEIINADNKESSFMVVLPTGEMRMIKSSDVGFFRYASDRKLWEAVLVTDEVVPLRRNVSAEFICAYNKNYIQVHQSYIINLDFLVMIHDSTCVLCPPFENIKEVTISRKYKKNLMDHFCIF